MIVSTNKYVEAIATNVAAGNGEGPSQAQALQQPDAAEGGVYPAGRQQCQLVQLRAHRLRCIAYGTRQVSKTSAVRRRLL